MSRPELDTRADMIRQLRDLGLSGRSMTMPSELVQVGARAVQSHVVTGTGANRRGVARSDEDIARSVLEAVSEAGWVRVDDIDGLRDVPNQSWQAMHKHLAEARAQAETAMAECVDLVEKLAQARNDNNIVCDERDHYRVDGNRQFQAAREARDQAESLTDQLENARYVADCVQVRYYEACAHAEALAKALEDCIGVLNDDGIETASADVALRTFLDSSINQRDVAMNDDLTETELGDESTPGISWQASIAFWLCVAFIAWLIAGHPGV